MKIGPLSWRWNKSTLLKRMDCRGCHHFNIEQTIIHALNPSGSSTSSSSSSPSSSSQSHFLQQLLTSITLLFLKARICFKTIFFITRNHDWSVILLEPFTICLSIPKRGLKIIYFSSNIFTTNLLNHCKVFKKTGPMRPTQQHTLFMETAIVPKPEKL